MGEGTNHHLKLVEQQPDWMARLSQRRGLEGIPEFDSPEYGEWAYLFNDVTRAMGAALSGSERPNAMFSTRLFVTNELWRQGYRKGSTE